MRGYITTNSTGIIFIHNHPSGEPEASSEDLLVTARLYEAGKILGIRVHDHIIIGVGKYMSFADEGWLTEPKGKALTTQAK